MSSRDHQKALFDVLRGHRDDFKYWQDSFNTVDVVRVRSMDDANVRGTMMDPAVLLMGDVNTG